MDFSAGITALAYGTYGMLLLVSPRASMQVRSGQRALHFSDCRKHVMGGAKVFRGRRAALLGSISHGAKALAGFAEDFAGFSTY